jgi:hypothetical protein
MKGEGGGGRRKLSHITKRKNKKEKLFFQKLCFRKESGVW